ncbi:unnamed protein product [Boreogadus saida]
MASFRRLSRAESVRPTSKSKDGAACRCSCTTSEMSWRESEGVAVMDVGQEVMACDSQWNHHQQQHLRTQAQDQQPQQAQQCRHPAAWTRAAVPKLEEGGDIE